MKRLRLGCSSKEPMSPGALGARLTVPPAGLSRESVHEEGLAADHPLEPAKQTTASTSGVQLHALLKHHGPRFGL